MRHLNAYQDGKISVILEKFLFSQRERERIMFSTVMDFPRKYCVKSVTSKISQKDKKS